MHSKMHLVSAARVCVHASPEHSSPTSKQCVNHCNKTPWLPRGSRCGHGPAVQ